MLPVLQTLTTVFSAALARVETLPEIEKPAANWIAALPGWLRVSFPALSHAWPELQESLQERALAQTSTRAQGSSFRYLQPCPRAKQEPGRRA